VIGADYWTQTEAIRLCEIVEDICPAFGCHVALTGGLLYKYNPPRSRKDCDLVLYRIRQVEKIDIDGLFAALAAVGIERKGDRIKCEPEVVPFVIKATYQGKAIDFLLPDASGEYEAEAKDPSGPGVGALFAEVSP